MQSAEFVYHMEEVLDLYHLPYDPNVPSVCFDESNKQLVTEKRTPVEAMPGQMERHDYEYKRNGVRNLFLFFSPLISWRHVKVTEQRTHLEWAACMKDLVDVHFPQATRIRVIQDNLNTHNPAFLYEVFEPAEADRIWNRLEIHYTPAHASWLNMAEIELSILSKQCLARRIPNEWTLITETVVWEQARNEKKAMIRWNFTVQDARHVFKEHYPTPLTC